jgi:hypothetical protein
VGFTPAWYRQHLDIDFGRRWHTDPAYRRGAVLAMREELARRFPGTAIGGIDGIDAPPDLLTGAFGACTVGGLFGLPIRFAPDQWPICEARYLTAEQVERLEPPDLDRNEFFQRLLDQLDWIGDSEGSILGYLNWQGVLNNAHRLRGESLLTDLYDAPDRCRRLFQCVAVTMIQAAHRVYTRQRHYGTAPDFFTVTNCLVNMISPRQYTELLLPFDRQIAREFGTIGIHNCGWNATPYLEAYAGLPHVAYIDMGIDSDLTRARERFPGARRAVMITPMALANQPALELQNDLSRIAAACGPCDIVLADIDAGASDARVLEAVEWCRRLSQQWTLATEERNTSERVPFLPSAVLPHRVQRLAEVHPNGGPTPGTSRVPLRPRTRPPTAKAPSAMAGTFRWHSPGGVGLLQTMRDAFL